MTKISNHTPKFPKSSNLKSVNNYKLIPQNKTIPKNTLGTRVAHHRKISTNRSIKFYHEESHSFLMVEFPRSTLGMMVM